jgi:hypothetical protein
MPQPDITSIGILVGLSCKGALPVGKLAEGHFGTACNLDGHLDCAPAGVTSVRRHD